MKRMDDRGRVEYLIGRFFDDVITAAEKDELESALRASPGASRAFVRSARMDQALYTHFHREEALQALLARLPKGAGMAGDLVACEPAPAPAAARLRAWWADWRTRHEHVWGPAGAVLIHAVLLVLLVRWVIVSDTGKPKGEEIAVTVFPREEAPPALDERPAALGHLPSDRPATPGPLVRAPDDLKPVDPSSDRPTAPPALNPLLAAPGSAAPLSPPPAFAGRSPANRRTLLDRHAGAWAARAETAVDRGAAWLTDRQSADGAWRGEGEASNPAAMTSLALLALLARSECTEGPEASRISHAFGHLLQTRQADGFFGSRGGNGAVYAHAIAVCAVSEGYVLTRIPALKSAAEEGVKLILAGQQDNGAWTYGYARNGRRDTSVSAWQVQALRTAMLAGLQAPGLPDALRRAVGAFQANQCSAGLFRYTGTGDSGDRETDELTATALYALQLAGARTAPSTRKGGRAIARAAPRWSGGDERWPLCGVYFMTQAKFGEGGASWARWNEHLARGVLARQQPDGRWESPGGREAAYGPVYSTAMASLALSACYRFPPAAELDRLQPLAHSDAGWDWTSLERMIAWLALGPQD